MRDMNVHDRAMELARSGRYADAREVMWALFKLGYGNAERKIGFLQRRRLTRLCRLSSADPSPLSDEEGVPGS